MKALARNYTDAMHEDILPVVDGTALEVIKEFMAAALAARGTFSMFSSLLPQQAKIVETATCDFTAKFSMLAGDATTQSAIIQQLINHYDTIEVGEKTVTLDQFVNFFSTTLDKTITKLLFVAKKAMAMVYGMEDAIKHLQEIETFSKNIQAITKRTHLLALNASIEAASAGAAGKGFNVVANEVKEVSKQISDISEQMNQRTRSITACVMGGYDMLKDVATADMESNIHAKDTLQAMLAGLIAKTEKSKKTMNNSVATSNNIAATISEMIMDMQFQDRNSQIAENASNMMRKCDELLACAQANAEQIMRGQNDTQLEKQAFDSLFSIIKLGDIRYQYMEALRIIGTSYSDMTQQMEKSQTDDDNVDLF